MSEEDRQEELAWLRKRRPRRGKDRASKHAGQRVLVSRSRTRTLLQNPPHYFSSPCCAEAVGITDKPLGSLQFENKRRHVRTGAHAHRGLLRVWHCVYYIIGEFLHLASGSEPTGICLQFSGACFKRPVELLLLQEQKAVKQR